MLWTFYVVHRTAPSQGRDMKFKRPEKHNTGYLLISHLLVMHHEGETIILIILMDILIYASDIWMSVSDILRQTLSFHNCGNKRILLS